MFFAVDWMYFGGRLLFFMFEARRLIHDDSDWKNFVPRIS
jgi:hypothetical protein